ncbi:MAG: L,D-transpeptidase [Oscillatoriales cyanobacterium SM2_1_8]|nr:L,D-transpeptidase [Oscillatoriales cyanobacterium SM2_1_8]
MATQKVWRWAAVLLGAIATGVEAAEVRLVLRRGDRQVVVYRGEAVQARYPVAVGKRGWETPLGRFAVQRLQKNPIWQNPWTNQIVPAGAKNPLGSRWIGFWSDGRNDIGFHGTPDRASVGQAASHGCVRMLEPDIQALFEVVQLGTPVEVVP